MKDKYRLEKKFLVRSLESEHLEDILSLLPFNFIEIFAERAVNNIYFDTPYLSNYFDNIDGNFLKRKTRIRWYGDLFGPIDKPKLEIKGKKGQFGTKDFFTLPNFTLKKGVNRNHIIQILQSSEYGKQARIKGLIPTLLNTYKRKYFLSADKLFRFTVDRDLSYYSLNSRTYNFLDKADDNQSVVLELKYDRKYEEFAEVITNRLPFRMTKSSKYIMGIERVVTHHQL